MCLTWPGLSEVRGHTAAHSVVGWLQASVLLCFSAGPRRACSCQDPGWVMALLSWARQEAPLSPLPSAESPSTPQSSLCLLGEVRGQGKVWSPLGLARVGRLGWIPGLPDENRWFLGGRGCPMPLLILIIFYFMKQDREVSDLLLFISSQCSKY